MKKKKNFLIIFTRNLVDFIHNKYNVGVHKFTHNWQFIQVHVILDQCKITECYEYSIQRYYRCFAAAVMQ